jgi:CheY-like chemotaxis protein
VFIVEDNEDLREIFADALRFEGYTVECARNGREAIEWLHAHPGERWVVLLDLMMPVMDGAAFLAQRRQDPVLLGFPVILLSAGGDLVAMADTHGVEACLPKTVSLPALIQAIEATGRTTPLPAT